MLGFLERLLAEVAAIDFSSLCEDSFVPFFNILFEHSDTTDAIISALTSEEFQTIFNRLSGNVVAQAVESAFSFLTASDVETYLFLMFRGSAFIALKELMKPRMNMNLLSATLFDYSILVLNYLGRKNGYDETELRGGCRRRKKPLLTCLLNFDDEMIRLWPVFFYRRKKQ